MFSIKAHINVGVFLLEKFSNQSLEKAEHINDAQLLLSFIINKDEAYILSSGYKKISLLHSFRFFYYIVKRIQGYSIAVILKQKYFYGYEFYVNKHVLIPRPDTEHIIEKSLETIENFYKTYNTMPIIADIGTGSGCIIITLIKELQKKPYLKDFFHHQNHKNYFFAVDISKKALSVAKINAQKHKLSQMITFKHGSLLSPLKNVPLDIIISNPPYISLIDYKNSPSIQKEPKIALTDNENGLSLYHELLSQLHDKTQRPFAVLLEIGYDQAAVLQDSIVKLFADVQISVHKDYAKLDRIVKILFKTKK